MPKVSVVLPVYNGEKYLEDTIDSIINQDFDDFELIIINDGSTDKSLDIINTKAKSCDKIIVFNQENKGISFSRNIGIKYSSSEYIMFCDHDDIYEKGFIKAAYNAITSKDYDFVKFGIREIYIRNKSIIREKNLVTKEEEFYGENLKNFLLPYLHINEYIWDGIYKKTLLEKVNYFDTFYQHGCEDIDILLKISRQAKHCLLNSKIYYYHFLRDKFSNSRMYFENTYYSVLRIYYYRNKLFFNNKEYIQNKQVLTLYALLGMFAFENCSLNTNEIIKRLKIYKNLVKNNFLNVLLGRNLIEKSIILLFNNNLFIVLALLVLIKRRFRWILK